MNRTGKAAGSYASLARWTAPISLPLVPAGGAVLANGKAIFWASNQPVAFNGSGNTYTALFDPATNTSVLRNVTETTHDFFCPGTARLADGRLLINGGYDPGKTSIYDPVADTWKAGAIMNIPRAYDGTAPLWDGSVLTLGGSWSGNFGTGTAEIYSDTAGWKLLPGVPDSLTFMIGGAWAGWPSDSHYKLIPTANGKVLLAGPSPNMSWINTQGNGSFSSAGPLGDDGPSFAGNTVMFDAGKILKVGGGPPTNVGDPANASAYLIDTAQGSADVTKLPAMAYPRGFHNSVVLPNGQVVVIGGQTNLYQFSDAFAVLAPELFDPQTKTFTVLPPMSVARNYHSIALLLPDGRVISGGGGLCACSADHQDIQILSPPYLFNADGSAATRPVITAAPAVIGYGNKISVTTNSAVTAFSFIRMNATTHDVNNDQRRVSLAFTATDATHYTVSIPSNPGILLPGQWMLFAMNSSGVPSIAAMVTVSNSGAPVVLNPGDVKVNQGNAINLPVNASTPSGALTMSATGLPTGVSINAATGTISGAPTTAGKFVVTILGRNASQTVSTDIVIDVVGTGSGTGLSAQYFGTATLSGPVLAQPVELPAINLPAATSPVVGVPGPIFSTRWTGQIEAVSSGATSIQTQADDGVRVWVNNQLIIDDWNAHPLTTGAGSVTLVAGRRYPITVEYFQAGGSAGLQLSWQPAGTSSMTSIPVLRLYPSPVPSTTNIALHKTATESSIGFGGIPSWAVDGNTDGQFFDASVSHTANLAPQDWWQVDLGSQSRGDMVQLWNRTDCCTNRLTNFIVFVAPYDMTSSSLAQLMADPTVIQRTVGPNTNVGPVIGIPINGLGRYVRVQLLGSNYLSLAEVQVWGGSGTYQTPSISAIGIQQSLAGSFASVQASGIDPTGNPLVYSASGLPPGVGINASTGLISGVATTPGAFNVTVTVSNGGGLSATTSFKWVILAAVPKVISLSAPAAKTGASVTYSPTLSSGAASTYNWSFGDGATAPASGSPVAIHTYAASGIYSVTLTITTLDGRSASYSFLQAVSNAASSLKTAQSSTNVLLAPPSNGTARLWVVNQDNDSVSVFDTGNNSMLAEVPVGAGPRTLGLASDGRIWVVSKVAATISIVDPSTFAVTALIRLPRGSQPFGIVFSPTDGSAFVTLEATGQLLKLNGATGSLIANVAIGANFRHLAINATGNQLMVTRFITPPLPGESTANVSSVDSTSASAGGQVILVDPATLKQLRTVILAYSNRPDGDNSGSGFPNYLGAPAISPDGKTAWVPSKQDNLNRGTYRNGIPLDFKHTVRSITSRIDLTTSLEDLSGRVDHNLSSFASAAAYHPNGAYLFVALEGNRQVAVVDAAGKRELARYNVGLAPEGLAVSADGLKLYVSNFMSRTVSVIDLTALVQFGLINSPPTVNINAITTEKLAANVLQGKQFFYDAADPRLAQQSYMSCAVCHNDAGHDGRTWDFSSLGEGLRNTISLRGRAGTAQGFMHWSANFDEVQDFEGQIRSFAGGTGLMPDADFYTGTRSQPLGVKKAGISAPLDALAAYVTSLNQFPSSPFRNTDGTLTAAAIAGKAVFVTQKCASCHGGAGFTLSSDATMLKNIGTIKPTSGSRFGGLLTGIDIPTLRDVWATAPYLHDGSAPTLSAAIAAHNGVTLTQADLANLSEYMREIGGDEPIAPGSFLSSPVFGSPSSGVAFTDPVTPGSTLTGLLVHSGGWLDGLGGFAIPANYGYHGGFGGGTYSSSWPTNQYLVRIYGYTASTVVSQLSFVTNTGVVYGPFGNNATGAPLIPFDFTVPAGTRIYGFTGSSGTYLNALGVIYGQ